MGDEQMFDEAWELGNRVFISTSDKELSVHGNEAMTDLLTLKIYYLEISGAGLWGVALVHATRKHRKVWS